MIWGAYRKSGLTYGSESDIQSFVRLVLMDAICEAGLSKEVTCNIELSIYHLRPDIWILCTSSGVPIGVVEVKKPDQNIMNSSLLHGQIYDYMLRLRHFVGLKSIFGIATTYAQWRIYWLPDTDEDAKSSHINPRPLPKPAQLPPIPDYGDENDDSKEERDVSKPVDEPREVWGTEVYSHDHPDLPKILVSVILKMYNSGTDESLKDKRYYIKVTPESYAWISAPNLKPDYARFPPSSNTKNFLLTQDLRGGAHGRVWLASTSSGVGCVLKFLQANVSKDILKREAELWNKLWNMPAKIQKLGGRKALVMPYVFQCREEDMEIPEILKAVSIAVQRMAESGYEHDDLSWRHVGLYRKNNELIAVLFDLAKVKKLSEEKKEQMAAVRHMLEKLGIRADA
jgi:hypothetical protein